MSAVSEKVPSELGAAPLNFIYACSVCCASFADVYEGHKDTVRGLSDGINPKDRLVTRLYLASCCHVFCSNHLEGGGKWRVTQHEVAANDHDRATFPCGWTATQNTMSRLHQGER
jgi:hypothetical protein